MAVKVVVVEGGINEVGGEEYDNLDFAKEQKHKPKGGNGEADYNCW